MPKREYCKNCQFPLKTCLCRFVQPLHYQGNITILQHPNESSHGKNTVRLIKLVLPSSQIIVGTEPGDFDDLIRNTIEQPGQFAVFYPSDASKPWPPQHNTTPSTPAIALPHIILLDATWRKAYRMWQQNTWLHNLPTFHLQNPAVGAYKIRKRKKDYQLSTLEALVQIIDPYCDTTPLQHIFHGFQTQFLAFSQQKT